MFQIARRWAQFCALSLLIVVALPAAASLSADALSPPDTGDGWTVSDPSSAGFDKEALAALQQSLSADEYSNLHAVIIEHNGRLVFEQYLSGTDDHWGYPVGRVIFDRDKLHDLRSITKSVTSLLLGIALGPNFSEALDKPVLDYLPGISGSRDITLRHVLTMTAGLEWNEMTVPYSNPDNDEVRTYYAGKPEQHVLSKPQRETPGQRWYYNGGLTMALAAVVEEVSGKSFVQFANDALFQPLGITDFKWYGPNKWRPRGMPAAASGLRLRTRDLAKIGSVVMNGGKWQGRQIVPHEWISISTSRHREDTKPWDDDAAYGYGFQWWHREFVSKGRSFAAATGMGHGGQRLFVLPGKQIAVTIFSGNYNSTDWWKSERVLSRIIDAWKQD